MIINLEGDTVAGIFDHQGVVSHYKDFAICLYYTDEQKTIYLKMKQLQADLRSTDYKATKYAEGFYTEEEYAPIKAERQAWRDEWNELNKQFVPPSITDEEAEEAISKWEAKHPVTESEVVTNG